MATTPLINFNEPQQLFIVDANTLRTTIFDIVKKALQEVKNEVEKPYSRKQVKALLQISDATLYGMQKAGKIHPKHIGGKVFFDKQEIDNFLKSSIS